VREAARDVAREAAELAADGRHAQGVALQQRDHRREAVKRHVRRALGGERRGEPRALIAVVICRRDHGLVQELQRQAQSLEGRVFLECRGSVDRRQRFRSRRQGVDETPHRDIDARHDGRLGKVEIERDGQRFDNAKQAHGNLRPRLVRPNQADKCVEELRNEPVDGLRTRRLRAVRQPFKHVEHCEYTCEDLAALADGGKVGPV
jgi:hypothetical protein